MLRHLSAAVAVIIMAGCSAAPLEVGSITEIQPTAPGSGQGSAQVFARDFTTAPSAASKNIDFYESKRAAGVITPEFSGEQLLEVRTYTVRHPAGTIELSGASCSLDAADFSATLQTPAKVRVPLYRQQSSPLAIVCELPGYKKKKVTVAVVDADVEKRAASSATGGLFGLISVAAIDALADESKSVWEYPVTKVILVSDAVAAR